MSDGVRQLEDEARRRRDAQASVLRAREQLRVLQEEAAGLVLQLAAARYEADDLRRRVLVAEGDLEHWKSDYEVMQGERDLYLGVLEQDRAAAIVKVREAFIQDGRYEAVVDALLQLPPDPEG